MPDFAVSTKLIIQENVDQTFGRLTKGVNQFGKTGSRSIKSVDVMFQRTTKDVSLFGRITQDSFKKAKISSRQFSQQMSGDLNRIKAGISGLRGRVGGIFGGITPGILAADVIRESFKRATTGVVGFITEAAKIERAITDFGILFNSVEKGKQTVDEIRTLAAGTPFSFKGLAETGSLLLIMGAATRKSVIPTLKMLGDLAKGSDERLGRIAFAMGEVASNSKASFQEVRQFTNAQVPLLAQLTKQWGLTGKNAGVQARKMIRAGRATLFEVAKAFKIMTSEGGIFFKATEKGTKTFEGRMVKLDDSVKLAQGTIGTAFLPTLKIYIDKAIKIAQITNQWAEANQDLIRAKFISGLDTVKNILKGILPIIKGVGVGFKVMLPVIETLAPLLPVLAAGWLANKVALGALALGQVALAVGKVVIALRAAATAQGIWNVLTLSNPIIAIVTGGIVAVTALVAGIVLVVKNWDFLVGTMKKGIFKIVGLFTFMLAPIIRIFSRLSGALASLFGFNELAENLKGIEKVFDALQRRIREKAGIKVFKVDPSIFKGVGLVEKFLKLSERQAARTPFPLPRVPFAFGGTAAPPAREEPTETPGGRRGLGGGFRIPGLETISKQIVEHVIKLNVAGLPAGATVSVDTGGEAPPIEVSVLGEQ